MRRTRKETDASVRILAGLADGTAVDFFIAGAVALLRSEVWFQTRWFRQPQEPYGTFCLPHPMQMCALLTRCVDTWLVALEPVADSCTFFGLYNKSAAYRRVRSDLREGFESSRRP